MGKYGKTLEQIIFHYTQDDNPFNIKTEAGRYPFLKTANETPVSERIDKAMDKIISPIVKFYDNEMKQVFWRMFCMKNLMREIEYETTTAWILNFNYNLLAVIDRYNEYYRLNAIKVDVTTDRNLKTERDIQENKEIDNTGNGTVYGETTNKNVYDETPVNMLGNVDYATNITSDNGTSYSANYYKSDEDTDRKLKEVVKQSGIGRPQSDLIKGYRETIIDVLRMMVDEVSKGLFFKLY